MAAKKKSVKATDTPQAKVLQPSGEWGNRMREDWNVRAERDVYHWTVNSVPEGQWNMDDYFATGESTIKQSVDLFLATSEIDPAELTVYEVGCGAGRLTTALARRFGHVIAADVSPRMVEAAAANCRAQGLTNVEFVVTDGATLFAHDSSLDMVFSCIVFQHIPDIAIQLGYWREVGRVLKPAGRFLIEMYGNEQEYPGILNEWQKRREANDAMGWSDLGKLELPRFETSMCTPVPAPLIDQVLDEAGLVVTHETGRGTGVWWLGGRKSA